MRQILRCATVDNSAFSDIQKDMDQRLSDVIASEPGYSAILQAARARRKFLNLLYPTEIQTHEGSVSIRSRRRNSGTGFERRLADWDTASEVEASENTFAQIDGALKDQQVWFPLKCVSFLQNQVK